MVSRRLDTGGGPDRGQVGGCNLGEDKTQRRRFLGGTWSYLSPGPAVGAEHPQGPLPVVRQVTQGGWAGGCPQGWAPCPFAGSLLNGSSGYCSHLWEQEQKGLGLRRPIPSFIPHRCPKAQHPRHTIEIEQDERAPPSGTGAPAPPLAASGSLCAATCPPTLLGVRGRRVTVSFLVSACKAPTEQITTLRHREAEGPP